MLLLFSGAVMRPDDLAYYRERAATERKRVEICEIEAVAAIHEELARQYEALVQKARLKAIRGEGCWSPIEHSRGDDYSSRIVSRTTFRLSIIP